MQKQSLDHVVMIGALRPPPLTSTLSPLSLPIPGWLQMGRGDSSGGCIVVCPWVRVNQRVFQVPPLLPSYG